MLWAQSTHEIKDWLQILYYTHVAVNCTEHVSLHSPRTTNLNRERKVGSSWSLAAWWTTSVAASFLLNLHHHHHSLHHSWPSPGSERAKGGPALDFQLQITEISRNVDLRTSGTGRIYPVPIWSGYGWDLSHLRRFQRHESDLTSKSKSQSPHPNRCSPVEFPHGVCTGGIDVGVLFLRILNPKGDRSSCQTIHCWNYYCSNFICCGISDSKSPLILEDVLENPHEKSSDSCAKEAKPMEFPFANLWEIDSVLWNITMFKRCLSWSIIVNGATIGNC